MCDQHDPFAGEDPFGDLRELEEDIWDKPAQGVSEADLDTTSDALARAITGGNRASQATTARYEEKCKKCRGSGNFVSYTGRIVGPCFTCKGTGVRQFRTSPETRQANRDRAQARKQAKADQQAADVQAWLDANPERAAFLQQDWEFPRSLREGLHKWGSLTDNQIAAIDRCLAKQADKAAARKSQVSDLDLSEVPAGLYAVPGGDTRLKVRIDKPTRGKWAGWVFVKDGAEYGSGTRYGSQRPGENYGGQIVDQLRAIASDPLEASKAYGRLVGVCGVCGRKLENEDSVAAGIGPVCAGKF